MFRVHGSVSVFGLLAALQESLRVQARHWRWHPGRLSGGVSLALCRSGGDTVMGGRAVVLAVHGAAVATVGIEFRVGRRFDERTHVTASSHHEQRAGLLKQRFVCDFIREI